VGPARFADATTALIDRLTPPADRPRYPTPAPLPTEPAPDVQAALTALARRPHHKHEHGRLNLAQLHLAGANVRNARLQDANLEGAQLQDASLSNAKLQGALLSGAQLQHASLSGAQLWGAHLGGAQLQGAHLVVLCYFGCVVRWVSSMVAV
jgi:hypothetical protein